MYFIKFFFDNLFEGQCFRKCCPLILMVIFAWIYKPRIQNSLTECVYEDYSTTNIFFLPELQIYKI